MASPWEYISGADWGNAANWSDVEPLTNDSVSVADGYQGDIDTGLDNGGVDLDNLLTPMHYAGNLGSSASPLIMAADLIEVKGAGEFHFECSAGGAAQKTDDCRVHAANRTSIVTLGSETGDAGDWDRIAISRGNVTLKGNIQYGASCLVDIAPASDQDVLVNIADADTLPTLHMSGGSVTCETQVTTAVQSGGTMEKKTDPIITYYLMGGTCYWTDPSVTGDGITIVVGPNAVLDFTRSSQEVVITNVWEMFGSRIYRDPSLVTFTNHYDLTTVR